MAPLHSEHPQPSCSTHTSMSAPPSITQQFPASGHSSSGPALSKGQGVTWVEPADSFDVAMQSPPYWLAVGHSKTGVEDWGTELGSRRACKGSPTGAWLRQTQAEARDPPYPSGAPTHPAPAMLHTLGHRLRCHLRMPAALQVYVYACSHHPDSPAHGHQQAGTRPPLNGGKIRKYRKQAQCNGTKYKARKQTRTWARQLAGQNSRCCYYRTTIPRYRKISTAASTSRPPPLATPWYRKGSTAVTCYYCHDLRP